MKPFTAKVRYEHKVHVECPQCHFDFQIQILNPLDISNIPQVGEMFTCSACGIFFQIDSEEVY